jgi:hypothetical protein
MAVCIEAKVLRRPHYTQKIPPGQDVPPLPSLQGPTFRPPTPFAVRSRGRDEDQRGGVTMTRVAAEESRKAEGWRPLGSGLLGLLLAGPNG